MMTKSYADRHHLPLAEGDLVLVATSNRVGTTKPLDAWYGKVSPGASLLGFVPVQATPEYRDSHMWHVQPECCVKVDAVRADPDDHFAQLVLLQG